MKRSEREALLKAFNIPEPQRKEAFVSEFNEKAKNKKPVILMSRYMRYSSIAAMLILAIGLAAHFSLSSDFFDKFNKDDPTPPAVVTTVTTSDETTSTSTVTQSTETTAVVTTSTGESTAAEKTDTTSKTENSTTSSKKATATSSVITTNRTTTSASQTGTRTTVSTTQSRTSTSTTRILSTSTTKTTTRILTSTSRTTRQTTTTRTTSRLFTTMTQTTSRMSTTMTQTTSRRTTLQLSTSNTTSRSTTSTYWGGMSTTNTYTTSNIPDSTSWIMSTTTNGGSPGDNYSDHTVSCDVYYSGPGENANVVNSSDILGANGNAPQTDLDELWDDSDYIFDGHVDKVRYTVLDGQTYTQVDITVRDSYKGRYSYYIGRKISVFFKGGYVPTRIYAKNHKLDFSYNRYRDYIYDDVDIVGKLPEENNDLLFFLRDPDTDTEPVSIRGFVPTYCESLSVFELYSTTYRSLGNDSVTFRFADFYRRKENEW